MTDCGCILGMPHVHEKKDGLLLIRTDRSVRYLSRWEEFLWRLLYRLPKDAV